MTKKYTMQEGADEQVAWAKTEYNKALAELEQPKYSQKNKLDQFDEQVQGLVNADRMRDYGHPADHFKTSSEIKRLLRSAFSMGHDEKDGDERLLHVLDMIADKMVRLCHSHNHLDSWIDIAGYARTAVMVIDNLEHRDIDPRETPFTDDAVQNNRRGEDEWDEKFRRVAMSQAGEFLPSFRGR